MYGNWMKNINLEITDEDIKKYNEDKKNNS